MRYTRLVAAILLAAYISACTGYKTMADPAAGLQASPQRIDKIRVTMKSGERFELKSPTIYGDSLRGLTAGGPPRTVALGDIGKVETSNFSGAKTAALVAGIVVVGGIVGAALAAASYSSSSCTLDTSGWTE